MTKEEPKSYEIKYNLIIMNIVGIVYFLIISSICSCENSFFILNKLLNKLDLGLIPMSNFKFI